MFIVTYSVMIDATTIENVFNTRYSEASGFFSWPLWCSIFTFGALPALYCLLQPVVFGKALMTNYQQCSSNITSSIPYSICCPSSHPLTIKPMISLNWKMIPIN